MNRIKYLTISVLAILHQVFTYLMDERVFVVPVSANPVDYVICKVCAFIASWFFFYALWQLTIDKNRKDNTITRVIKAALPYLIIMIPVAVIKMRGGYLSNDETLIYENAVTLTHYTWFYYITTYYYIICMMLIPHMYAPIFIKLLIEYLVIGYTVLRSGDYFRARSNEPFLKKPLKIGYGCLIMLLFILYPVIAYTTSAHRLPIYFFLYLFIVVMLLFDRLEHASLTLPCLITLFFLGAVLTQWRTEGIYLVILVPVLMFITYDTLTIREKH
ncbi:MAG: hypothetical protein IKX95_07075, partial [Lachnospiraceae bacterium]|nr:hypothetical protein [Lachnospiraceae bacterium]